MSKIILSLLRQMEKNGCNPIKYFLLYVSRWKSELDDKTFLIANITYHLEIYQGRE